MIIICTQIPNNNNLTIAWIRSNDTENLYMVGIDNKLSSQKAPVAKDVFESTQMDPFVAVS